MPLSAGVRLGPYEIVAPIGAGGMGEVYRALDTRLGRTVAIKVLPPHVARSAEMRTRFEREARTISNLNDSNVCTLHDIGEQDGTYYLVMEHLEGETLAARLTRGALSDADTIRYATQIASALHRAHEKGIVHRDLKPANVMLTKSGAKLLDFGLAKLADIAAGPDDATRREPLTSEGTVMGTLAYMAPEQLSGETIDARADIFAFGAVLYEMTTGRRAFEAPSRVRLMTAIMEEQPPPVSEIRPLAAPVIQRVVEVALAKKAEDRWQSARDIVLLLQSPATGMTPPAQRVAAGRQMLFLAAALGLLIGTLATAGWMLLRRTSRVTQQAKIRSIVDTGAETRLGRFGAMALSPDGRSIAFMSDRDGQNRLHIQRLDGTGQELVPSSSEPIFPFWSSDSRYVGFFLLQDKKIKKFDTVTKSIQSVANSPGIGGPATWGPNGDILFINGPNGGVYRVKADGGTPALLTRLDTKSGEIGHLWPRFLPDGEHFLYLALTSGEGQDVGKNLYVTSLDAPQNRKLLVRNASNAAFVPPHHLIFARDTTLMVQHFDPKTLEISGEAVPLVSEPIAFNANAALAEFSVSPDGLLAFIVIATQKTRLVVADRQGNPPRPLTDVGFFMHPSVSPDGSRVAVTRQLPDSRLNGIVVYDVAGGAVARVTNEAGDYDYPLWSPDGRSLAYGSNRRTLREICRRAADGSGDEEVLLNVGKEDVPIDWSDDGQHILFRRLDAKTFYDLWALSLAPGRKQFPLITTPLAEQQGAISPDGRWIAYTSNADSTEAQLFIASFPGGEEPRRIGAGKQPHWRSDGRQLFYIAPDLKLTALPFDNGKPAGPPQPLRRILSPETSAFGRVYDVFPGGQQFLLREAIDEERPHVVLVQGAFSADEK